MSDSGNDFLSIFLEEADDMLETWEKTCLEIETNPSCETFVSLFRTAHNMKGSAASVGLNAFSAFVHKIEDTITLLKDGKISITPELIGVFFKCHDIFVEWIEAIKEDPNATMNVTEILILLPKDEDHNKTADTSLGFGFFDDEIEDVQPKNIGEILVESGHATEEQIELAAKKQNRKIGEILVEEGIVSQDSVNHAVEKQKQKKTKLDESIRVSANKLDELLRMIGELSTQQSIIWHCKQKGELNSTICTNSIQLCNKIVKDLQSHALGLRMQPLETLLQRMERIIRDTGRKQEKELDLTISGETVELDKSVIEKIKDPLVHIVRNAVDHGLESTDERVQIGKPRAGKLTLEAKQEANGVKLIISDDGRGMDPDKILKKAIEKGLIAKNTNLPVEKIFELILLPNFSTRDEVTDLSGRGVGMNVVKETLDQIGGNLQIISELGKGTQFHISLPTNVSIIESLIIAVNNMPYAIPIQDLSEVIDLDEYKIDTRTKQGEMISVRGQVIPVKSLSSYLPDSRKGLEISHDLRSHKPGLITSIGTQSVVFKIDKILGQQSIVVRNLDGKLSQMDAFAGATIFGDGEPGMIISLPILAKHYLSKVPTGGRNAG